MTRPTAIRVPPNSLNKVKQILENEGIAYQVSKMDVQAYVLTQFLHIESTFRKHAYSNILKISPPKTENFQIKKSDNFLISAEKHRLWVLVRTASASYFCSKT